MGGQTYEKAIKNGTMGPTEEIVCKAQLASLAVLATNSQKTIFYAKATYCVGVI